MQESELRGLGRHPAVRWFRRRFSSGDRFGLGWQKLQVGGVNHQQGSGRFVVLPGRKDPSSDKILEIHILRHLQIDRFRRRANHANL